MISLLIGEVQPNNRAICMTVVLKMLKTNCGAMPMANMSSVTGTMTNFSPRVRSGNALQLSASGPLKSDCIARRNVIAVNEKPENGDRCEDCGDCERAFENQKLADESVQPGQAERGEHGDAHPAAEEWCALHQAAEIIDPAQAAALFEQTDKVKQRGRSDAVIENLHEDAAQRRLHVDHG